MTSVPRGGTAEQEAKDAAGEPPNVGAAGLPPEPLCFQRRTFRSPVFLGAVLGVPELHALMVTASFAVLLHGSPLPFLI